MNATYATQQEHDEVINERANDYLEFCEARIMDYIVSENLIEAYMRIVHDREYKIDYDILAY